MQFRLQACRALELAGELSDEEVFVLMAIQSAGKGKKIRIFPISEIDRGYVTGPLADRKLTLNTVLKQLLDRRMLNPAGRKKFLCTTEGDLVKHNFNDVYDHLVTHGTIEPVTEEILATVPLLRSELENLCAESRR